MKVRLNAVAALLSVATAAIMLSIPVVAMATTADTAVTWGVRPADNDLGDGRPNYVYSAEPGDVLSDGMVIENYGDQPLTFRVYAADGFVTPAGSLDLLAADEASVDVGTWVRLDDDEVTVAPGQRTEVPFTVSVPDDATPGDHTGGVVTSLLVNDAEEGITVERRLGSRMHVRVGGELAPSLAVEDLTVDYAGHGPVSTGDATVSYTVVNTGNARMSGTHAVTVAGPFGLFDVSAPSAELPELLPGSTHDVEVVLPGVTPAVRLTATVALAPAVATGDEFVPGDAVEAAVSVWAVPWLVVGVPVVLVVWAARRAMSRRGSPRG